MSGFLLIGLVWAVLLLFWFWLGKVFDAISDCHRAMREASQADGERGS